MTAMTLREARQARGRPRLFMLAIRIVRMEVRHSAFVWAIPLLAVLFIYDPFHTASSYPALWTLRASVVLDKFWPVCVPFAAAFCAWAVSLTAVCALTFTLGALFPGRFTAPIVAVGVSVLVLAAFSRAVSQGGVSVASLSPDGIVPGNDAGVFYPVAPDVSIVQVMFYAGCALGAIGLLGLSPRTGGAGWRGALDLASGGGARLRTVATAVFAAGIALAVIGFGLAATARVSSVTGGIEVPALDNSASDKPIPYTPVCADVPGGFQVCLHPAFKGYLSQAVNSFGPVIAELSGLPGTPHRAVEIPGQELPSLAAQANADGFVTGNPPVYEFSVDNAIAQVPNAARFQDGFRQDIVHAVIVGSIGQLTASGALQWNAGTQAQQAVVNGLLKAVGSQPQVACNPYVQQCTQQPQVTAAAARFAALPAATRHAWLAANLAALKAGHVTVAQVP